MIRWLETDILFYALKCSRVILLLHLLNQKPRGRAPGFLIFYTTLRSCGYAYGLPVARFETAREEKRAGGRAFLSSSFVSIEIILD